MKVYARIFHPSVWRYAACHGYDLLLFEDCHRNAAPEDPCLKHWSALVSDAGSLYLAEEELNAAKALGLQPGRSLQPAPPPSNPDLAPGTPQSAVDKP